MLFRRFFFFRFPLLNTQFFENQRPEVIAFREIKVSGLRRVKDHGVFIVFTDAGDDLVDFIQNGFIKGFPPEDEPLFDFILIIPQYFLFLGEFFQLFNLLVEQLLYFELFV